MEKKHFEVDINGNLVKLAAKVKDGDELLFFIHGLGCAKECFDRVFECTELNKYSIITFDLPGFGESSKPSKLLYNLEFHAEICEKLLVSFPASKVHIIGHSMGGAIGVLLFERIKERVLSFANVEGNLISKDASFSRRFSALSHENTIKMLEAYISGSIGKAEPAINLWKNWIKKSSPIAFNRSALSLVEWSDSGELLKRFLDIKCRKNYFFGEKNHSMPVLERIPVVQKSFIKNSGHFPMIENPEEFYLSLYKFFELK